MASGCRWVMSRTTQVYGVSPVLPHGIWPRRLSCSRPLERGYVSGVPLDLAGSRAQMRAHRRRGVRSAPWSGTLWATPGSSGAMLETCGSAGEGCTFPVSELRSQAMRSEEHTSELQSRRDLVCRLLLEKKK